MARTAQCLQFSCGGAVISWITLVGRKRLSMSPDGSGKAPLRVIARSRIMVSTAARLSASSRCTQLTTSRSNSRRPTCQMLGGTSPAPSFAGTCNLHQHHRGFSLPGTVLGVASGVWGLMRAQHDWPEQSGPGPGQRHGHSWRSRARSGWYHLQRRKGRFDGADRAPHCPRRPSASG